MKTCRKCGQTKPASEMKRDARYTGGLSSYCKACHQAASVAWQKANPERLNETRRRRYERQKERLNAARRESYDRNTARWVNLWRLYGVDRDWYERTLANQGGGCAICGAKPSESKRAFHVDHDHKCCSRAPTCKRCNRGILCHSCNTALHAIERNPGWTDAALQYLGERA